MMVQSTAYLWDAALDDVEGRDWSFGILAAQEIVRAETLPYSMAPWTLAWTSPVSWHW
jgi:hypothetical protein